MLPERRLPSAACDQPHADLDNHAGEDEDEGNRGRCVHEGHGGQSDAVGGAEDSAAKENRPGSAVSTLPFPRPALDAPQAQAQGRAACVRARGQARGKEVESARDQRQGEENDKDNRSDGGLSVTNVVLKFRV